MGCWKNKDGRCVLQDDMGQFYPMLEEADVLVFVSPVYWFNLGGQIKQFIDRCYALGGLELPDGANFLSHKKIGLVLAHEGDDPYVSGGINAIRSIQDTCSYVGATFAGALYGCANNEGEAANNPALLEKAIEYGSAL
jgi:multimeric flavodoxin WrbA